jgi:hypothetical protein
MGGWSQVVNMGKRFGTLGSQTLYWVAGVMEHFERIHVKKRDYPFHASTVYLMRRKEQCMTR